MQEPKEENQTTTKAKAPAKKQVRKAKAEGVAKVETAVAVAKFDPPLSEKVAKQINDKLSVPHGVNQFRSVINSLVFQAGWKGSIRVTRK